MLYYTILKIKHRPTIYYTLNLESITCFTYPDTLLLQGYTTAEGMLMDRNLQFPIRQTE